MLGARRADRDRRGDRRRWSCTRTGDGSIHGSPAGSRRAAARASPHGVRRLRPLRPPAARSTTPRRHKATDGKAAPTGRPSATTRRSPSSASRASGSSSTRRRRCSCTSSGSRPRRRASPPSIRGGRLADGPFPDRLVARRPSRTRRRSRSAARRAPLLPDLDHEPAARRTTVRINEVKATERRSLEPSCRRRSKRSTARSARRWSSSP